MALAIVGHVHGDCRRVAVVDHARMAAGGFGDGVAVDAGALEHDLTEVEGRGVAVGGLAHRDGRVLRHRGAALGLDRELELLARVPLHALHALGQREVGRHTGGRNGGVRVHELALGDLRGGVELALAIVGDRHGDVRGVVVVGDARHGAAGLLDRVLVHARLLIADRTEAEFRRVALGGLGHRGLRLSRHRRVLGHRCEHEFELAVFRPRDARQLLCELQPSGHALERLRVVRVRELRSFDCGLGFEPALAVVGHFHRHLCFVRVIGNAGHITLRFLDRVLVHARLLVADRTEAEARGVALGGLGHRGRRPGRHRSAVLAFERELERTILRPINASQLLRERHARGHAVEWLCAVRVRELRTIHLCGRDQMAEAVVGDRHRHVRLVIVVRDAKLAVVAFGDHVLVGTGLGEGERTEGEVGSVAVARLAHGDRGLLRSGRPVHSLDHERELAAFRPLSARQFLRERHAFRHTVELLGGVGVDEVGLIHNRLGFQLAVAVVGHRHSHRGLVVVEGDARHDAGQLLDRVGVGARLGVGDVAKREVRRVTLVRLAHRLRQHAILRALRHRGAVLACQREREHAVVRPCGARQLLGERHARGHASELLGGIGVGELTTIGLHRGLKLTLAVVTHRHGHLGGMRVIGHARHIALRFLDRVGVDAHLGIGDVAEHDVRGITVGRLADRDVELAVLRALRHRGIALGRKRELEGAVSRPLDAGQLL